MMVLFRIGEILYPFGKRNGVKLRFLSDLADGQFLRTQNLPCAAYKSSGIVGLNFAELCALCLDKLLNRGFLVFNFGLVPLEFGDNAFRRERNFVVFGFCE